VRDVGTAVEGDEAARYPPSGAQPCPFDVSYEAGVVRLLPRSVLPSSSEPTPVLSSEYSSELRPTSRSPSAPVRVNPPGTSFPSAFKRTVSNSSALFLTDV